MWRMSLAASSGRDGWRIAADVASLISVSIWHPPPCPLRFTILNIMRAYHPPDGWTEVIGHLLGSAHTCACTTYTSCLLPSCSLICYSVQWLAAIPCPHHVLLFCTHTYTHTQHRLSPACLPACTTALPATSLLHTCLLPVRTPHACTCLPAAPTPACLPLPACSPPPLHTPHGRQAMNNDVTSAPANIYGVGVCFTDKVTRSAYVYILAAYDSELNHNGTTAIIAA